MKNSLRLSLFFLKTAIKVTKCKAVYRDVEKRKFRLYKKKKGKKNNQQLLQTLSVCQFAKSNKCTGTTASNPKALLLESSVK